MQPISMTDLRPKMVPPSQVITNSVIDIFRREQHQQEKETVVLYSSEKVGRDYVTVAEINTRTGVEQHQLAVFVVKEMTYNALDDLEKNIPIRANSRSIIRPQVQVYIAKERNYGTRVQNSGYTKYYKLINYSYLDRGLSGRILKKALIFFVPLMLPLNQAIPDNCQIDWSIG
ncbi:MAG: hypothetical protein WAM14_02735 [Candidatus Nitrosopolaris sp.]